MDRKPSLFSSGNQLIVLDAADFSRNLKATSLPPYSTLVYLATPWNNRKVFFDKFADWSFRHHVAFLFLLETSDFLWNSTATSSCRSSTLTTSAAENLHSGCFLKTWTPQTIAVGAPRLGSVCKIVWAVAARTWCEKCVEDKFMAFSSQVSSKLHVAVTYHVFRF